MMRLTRLDGCGSPVYGDCGQIVTDGFISVALSAQINEGEAITVTKANGKTCVNDAPSPTFGGYTAELNFCNVDPELFALVTGQETVKDAKGDVVGFRMSDKVSLDDSGFALEVWAGVPGEKCDTSAAAAAAKSALGYILLPYLKGGVLGDFTIENAAVNFTITGAATKSGAGWGVGPYDVVTDNGVPGPLNKPIGAGDHLHVQFTQHPAPTDPGDGCRPLLDPSIAPGTAPTIAGGTGNKATVTVSDTAHPIYIEWGDGNYTYQASPSASIEHTYAAPGDYKATAQQGKVTTALDVTVTKTR
jgi:hypothetical protein